MDGDKVVITTTGSGTLVSGVNVLFDASGHHLQYLDLTDAAFQGADLSIIATPVGGSDGFVNVGFINANGTNLGTVVVDGDLGRIDAGIFSGGTRGMACKSLTVHSLGVFGTTTGAPDLISSFGGTLGKLTVKGDLKDAWLRAVDSVGENGKLGSVFVGGSIMGGTADQSGQISAEDGIGLVTIKGDIVGGKGTTSGSVTSEQKIAGVSVGGSIIGGSSLTSGVIFSSLGSLGPVKIGQDVLGGTAQNSGRVFGRTGIASLSLGGSLVGGRNTSSIDSGQIHSDAPSAW